MAALETAKQARAGTRGWVTRAVKDLLKALDADPVDKYQLEAAMAGFDSRIAALDEAQTAYELLIDEAAMAEDIETAGDFRDEAVQSRTRATKTYAKLLSGDHVPPGSSESGTTDMFNRVKLPKIELPKFFGDVLEWESFNDQFDANVHELDVE